MPQQTQDDQVVEAAVVDATGEAAAAAADQELVADDLLVEDVSIDGMCGVY